MIEVSVRRGDALKRKTPCLVIGVGEGKWRPEALPALDAALDGICAQALRDREFSGKPGEVLLLHNGRRLAPQRVLLVGLGSERGYGAERIRQALGAAATLLQGKRIATLTLDLDSFSHKNLPRSSAAATAAEALALAAYRYDAWRGESGKELAPTLSEATLLTRHAGELTATAEAVTAALALCDGVHLARDLVNTPGNAKAPLEFARRCREAAAATGISCTVLERDELRREGMGGLLGVAQGSEREPCLIVLEYRGAAASVKPVALVGKGVMFDSGGISLKPAEKMDEMKMDMAGGAATLATLLTAARLKLAINLVGIIPAVENMPSGTAIRPGDVLTTLSGKTIEVVNTDAEGRLILADALTYAQRYKPRAIVDLATLTGACIIALGSHASAILGNDERLIRDLIAAGNSCGERLWQLPLWDDYARQLKSEIADLKNSGGRPAGTITAAAFLHAFVKGVPWAHLDIAGTAWEEQGRPCQPKGGTGIGVRLLIEYLRQSDKN